MSEIKVYLFYLRNDKELYAYTIDKEYKERFLLQRNKDCFHVKKIKMDKIEFSTFSYKYNNRKLMDIPLSTSITEYTMILATAYEDDLLTEIGNQIDHKMEELYKELILQSNIKKKYSESLEYLLKTTLFIKQKDGTKDYISTINLLFLFSQLFKNTFVKQDKNDEDDIRKTILI